MSYGNRCACPILAPEKRSIKEFLAELRVLDFGSTYEHKLLTRKNVWDNHQYIMWREDNNGANCTSIVWKSKSFPAINSMLQKVTRLRYLGKTILCKDVGNTEMHQM